MLRRVLLAVMLAVAVVLGASAPPVAGGAPSGAMGSVTTHTLTNHAGTRAYQVYSPVGVTSGRPLIVWVHGASEVPDGDARELQRTSTLLTEADRLGFSVVAPMQSLSADPAGIWKIVEPKNLIRGQGETSILADIVQRSIRELRADPKRVYVAGHSAGGAMVGNLAALYPELFAGMSVSAGVPYLADPTGIAARAARGRHSTLPTFIIQGDRDDITPPLAGEASRTAALSANGLLGTPARSTVRLPARDGDRYPTVLTRYGSGWNEVVYANVLGAGHPSGPGGFTVNGPALDRRAIAFLLSHRRV